MLLGLTAQIGAAQLVLASIAALVLYACVLISFSTKKDGSPR